MRGSIGSDVVATSYDYTAEIHLPTEDSSDDLPDREDLVIRRVSKSPALPPAFATSSQRKTLSRVRRGSSHKMTTRSKAKCFQIMNLPAELRNNIYGHVLQSSSTLANIPLPPLLSVCREIRSEALPIFFAECVFSTRLRSNWCLRSEHLHCSRYLGYDEAGQLELSPLLLQVGSQALATDAIRFRHLQFTIDCVCCDTGIEIGFLSLEVVEKLLKVDATPVKSVHADTRAAFGNMIEMLEDTVADAAKTDRFNGFTVEDLVQIGQCFRIEVE